MLPWKTPAADVRGAYALHLQLGLAGALAVVTGLLYVPFGGGDTFEIVSEAQEIVQVEEVERTQQFLPPPPPPPAPPPPVEVPDAQVIEEEIVVPELRLDLDVNLAPPSAPPARPAPPPAPAVEAPPPAPAPAPEPEVFVVVEEMPELIGGLESIRPAYPVAEQRAEIEGRVIVEFVVREDGAVSDLQVIRSVSPGLDAAAVEAIRTQARFRPGRQRGVPVRVRFAVPISFRLAR